MSRRVMTLTHGVTLLVAGSGLVLAWMLYLLEPAQDEFGLALVNHPWQPSALAWHVVTAPVLVFVLGYLTPVHVWPRLLFRNPRARRSGLALAIVSVPMVLSAYLLQVSVAEEWRARWTWLHVGSSLLWCVLYLAHLYVGRTTSEFAPAGGAASLLPSAPRDDVGDGPAG